MKKKDKILVGSKFGMLTVIGDSYVVKWDKPKSKSASFIKCRCDCGNEREVRVAYLNYGSAKSCGCSSGNRKHLMAKSKEFKAWQLMKARCYNDRTINFHDYGGRGISVCDRWLHSFENFYLDMGPKPTGGHSLDRFPDVNGNYEQSNCRWATRTEQARNRRNMKQYEYKGEKKILIEWAEEYKIETSILWDRINNGWSFDEAINTPKCLPNQKIHTDNFGVKPFLFKIGSEEKSINEWCKVFSKNPATVKSRYFRSMSLEESLKK